METTTETIYEISFGSAVARWASSRAQAADACQRCTELAKKDGLTRDDAKDWIVLALTENQHIDPKYQQLFCGTVMWLMWSSGIANVLPDDLTPAEMIYTITGTLPDLNWRLATDPTPATPYLATVQPEGTA